MSSWVKLSNDYRPKVGEELLATFSDYPEGIGTLYSCIEVTLNSFKVQTLKTISTTEVIVIAERDREIHQIPFTLIPLINLHRKFSFVSK